MSLVTQTIEHLLSGITQRPGVQRQPEQLTAGDNVFGRLGHGLMKRPPTLHEDGGKLTATQTGFDDVFVHAINRTDTERYRLVIANGVLTVYDALTGSSVTVNVVNGSGYIAGTGPFRAVTVGDSTFIVNTATKVKRGSTKFARALPQALITVKESGYDLYFRITLGGTAITWRTPSADVDTEARQLSHEIIAEQLENRLSDSFTVQLPFLGYTVSRKGATILINRKIQLRDFEIEVEDGNGGTALQLVRGEVQTIADLPPFARDGMVVRVIGDPLIDQDDSWWAYTDRLSTTGTPLDKGVWTETGEPGTFRDFDKSTMPHQLVAQGIRFVNDVVMEKTLFEPSLSYELASAEVVDGWNSDPKAGDISKSQFTIMTREGDRRNQTLLGAVTFNGDKFEIIISFNVDTTKVPNGVDTELTVGFFDDSAGSDQDKVFKSYAPGQKFIDEVFAFESVIDANDDLFIKLSYKGGVTPLRNKRAEVFLPGLDTLQPPAWKTETVPIAVRTHKLVVLDFNVAGAVVTYPKGTRVTVDLNAGADSFIHNVVGADGETSSTVANALFNLIDPDGSYIATLPAPGVLKIENQPVNKVRVPAIVDTFFPDGNLVFFSSKLALTNNALVGLELQNITDGSTATIDSNRANSITVTVAPTDGQDNDYKPGDIFRVNGTGTYFEFEQVAWKSRNVGNDDLNAYPSFMGHTISEVFFFRNRLGFTSKETVTLSESGDIFDLFRQSVTRVGAADRIDIQSASQSVSEFHSAVVHNKRLFLWADNGQFELGGEPLLTPETVFLNSVGQYPTTPLLKPLEASDSIFFAHSTRGSVRVFNWQAPPENSDAPATVDDMTVEIPDFIPGQVTDWAADPALGILALATDSVRSDLFIFAWTRQGKKVLQAGWFRWRFPAASKIDALTFQDGKLSMVIRHVDGVYLELLDFDTDLTPANEERSIYMDRRLREDSADIISIVFAAGDTVITMGYDVNTDQVTDGAVIISGRDGSFTRYTVTRAAIGTATVAGVDLTGVNFYLGISYEARATLSPIYLRSKQDGKPATRGRLMLKNIGVHFHDTTDFNVEFTPQNNVKYTTSLAVQNPGSGIQRVSTPGRAEDALIDLVNATSGGFRVSSVDWEGFFTSRAGQR